MQAYSATLLMSEFVTHDVKRFIVTKPPGFSFQSGQAVDMAINHPAWKKQNRPFTPTNFVDDQVLEFTIKAYREHAGITQKLHCMPAGTELLLWESFGTIRYQGLGVFLAAGTGITPFISILREQASAAANDGNTLIYSNKTPDDVIYEKELRHYLGDRCILSCTKLEASG